VASKEVSEEMVGGTKLWLASKAQCVSDVVDDHKIQSCVYPTDTDTLKDTLQANKQLDTCATANN